MNNCKACQGTLAKDLEDKIMNSNIPKSESEWWANRRIAALETAVKEKDEEIEKLTKSQGFRIETIKAIQENEIITLDENNRLLVLLTEMSSISHNLIARKDMLKDGGNHWQEILLKIEELGEVTKKVNEDDLVKRYQANFDFLLSGWNHIRLAVVRAAKMAGLEIPSGCIDAEVPSDEDCVFLCCTLGEQTAALTAEREKYRTSALVWQSNCEERGRKVIVLTDDKNTWRDACNDLDKQVHSLTAENERLRKKMSGMCTLEVDPTSELAKPSQEGM